MIATRPTGRSWPSYSDTSISVRKKVAELVALHREVVAVLGGRFGMERLAPGDGEAVPVEPHQLARVVGHHPDGREAEVAEDLRPDAVVPEVRGEPELGVRLDGVGAPVLDGVRLELVD